MRVAPSCLRVVHAPAGMRGRTQRGCIERAESPPPAAAARDDAGVVARDGRCRRAPGAMTAAWVLHTAAYIGRVWTCVVQCPAGAHRSSPSVSWEFKRATVQRREAEAALRMVNTLRVLVRSATTRRGAAKVLCVCARQTSTNRRA